MTYPEGMKPEIGDIVKFSCIFDKNYHPNIIRQGEILKKERSRDIIGQKKLEKQKMIYLINTGNKSLGLIWMSEETLTLIERTFKTHIRAANKRT